MRFQLIDAAKEDFSVQRQCTVLDEVPNRSPPKQGKSNQSGNGRPPEIRPTIGMGDVALTSAMMPVEAAQ